MWNNFVDGHNAMTRPNGQLINVRASQGCIAYVIACCRAKLASVSATRIDLAPLLLLLLLANV